MLKFSIAGALAGVMLAGSLAASQATELKYSLFMAPRVIEGRVMAEFGKELEAKTDGRVTLRIFAGGQLFSGPATLNGIRDGAVDGGFVVAPLTMAELKHVNILSDMVAYQLDPLVTAAAANETLMINCEGCREDFAAHNAVMLGGHATTPWKLLCTKPVSSLADLQGRKVRVIGGAATRLVSMLGMVGVILPASEIAPAMAGGQIDCSVGPVNWLQNYSLWDSAKTVVDIDLGISGGLGYFVFNKDSLAALSAEDRATFIELTPTYIAKATQGYIDDDAAARAAAAERGVTFVQPSADIVAALEKFRATDLPNIANDVRARGVENPEAIMEKFVETYKAWEKRFAEADRTPETAARLMQEHIFSVAPPGLGERARAF